MSTRIGITGRENTTDMDFTVFIASTIMRPTAIAPKPNAQIKRVPAAGSRLGAKSCVQMLAKTYAAESNVVA